MPSLVDPERQAELAAQSKTGFTDAVFETRRIASRLDAAVWPSEQTSAHEQDVQEVKVQTTRLLEANAEGEAVALVEKSARRLEDIGDEQAAVGLYYFLATQLLARRNFGWAAAAYYGGAGVSLAQGRPDLAEQMLCEAHEKLKGKDSFQTQRIERHLSILGDRGTRRSRLERMREDFAQSEQHALAQNCTRGLEKLQNCDPEV